MQRLAKRIYKTLELDGYARIDFRLSSDNVPYFLDANPNPDIARYEVFADSAAHDGFKYPALLDRILALGLSRARARRLPIAAAGSPAATSGDPAASGPAACG